MKEQLKNKLLFKISLFSLYTAFALEAGISSAVPVSKLEDWRFDPQALQLEITLSAPSQPRYFFLSQPSRIVVDLPSTKLGYVSTQQNFSGAIKSIRVSQLNADVTRIVMDLMPGTFINPNQVQLQPLSPQNPTHWVLRPVTASNNTYSTPTNIFPSYQQTPNAGLYSPPPPSQNQPFTATNYYNQQSTINNQQLPATNYYNQQPTINNQQLPATNYYNQQSTINNQQLPATNYYNQQSTINNQQLPATNYYNQQSTINNQQLPATNYYNQQSTINNQQLPATNYYNQQSTINNQQPLVTVPPLLPDNPSQPPNSTLPPAIFPNQSGNLNNIPFFPTPNLPNYPLPNPSNHQITNPNSGAIEFGQPLPNNTR
ncbi:AMIN domain-containing protein [Fischerella sp. FACHB-380]|nr:AMIN domain-containing protein [Fischerella sp. FACHB-380]MBD2432270.1 AMIN domain-containing protein [Fischerella sp. FACHB-380]